MQAFQPDFSDVRPSPDDYDPISIPRTIEEQIRMANQANTKLYKLKPGAEHWAVVNGTRKQFLGGSPGYDVVEMTPDQYAAFKDKVLGEATDTGAIVGLSSVSSETPALAPTTTELDPVTNEPIQVPVEGEPTPASSPPVTPAVTPASSS